MSLLPMDRAAMGQSLGLTDAFDRPLRNLRLSVTDRCNLRCQYCMPEEEYTWLPREDLLTFEEISTLVDVFTALGVEKVRLTGGEPLLRRDVATLVHLLARNPRVQDLDTVVMRGTNDDEIVDLIEYGKQVEAEVRFIEYMDVGGATSWMMEKVCSRAAMLARLSQHYGPIAPVVEETWAPAERFCLPDGTVFGIIASTTAPFCRTCDRSRLTADGMWYLCLYARQGIDLRQPLRAGASPEELASIIIPGWQKRRDRGAEERKALETHGARSTLIPLDRLRKDPHLEMHTRGG